MIDPSKVKLLLEEIGDSFFFVEFEKKNGQRRKMLCRRGVTKGLVDPERPQLPSYANVPDLVGVWDLQKGAYRCFSINKVIRIAGAGKVLR